MRPIGLIAIILIYGVCCFAGGYFAHRTAGKIVPDETTIIRTAAERNDCYGDDYLILLAIRKAENGGPGKEFGVKHPKAWGTDLDTQAGWAAATIVKNRARYESCSSHGDFIEFLGNRYCPASVDPVGNVNWKKNVRHWYERYANN